MNSIILYAKLSNQRKCVMPLRKRTSINYTAAIEKKTESIIGDKR